MLDSLLEGIILLVNYLGRLKVKPYHHHPIVKITDLSIVFLSYLLNPLSNDTKMTFLLEWHERKNPVISPYRKPILYYSLIGNS